ncbi:MAG: DUF1351 domain-containing protein [Bacilli bacterium]|jgi:hypothetical protein
MNELELITIKQLPVITEQIELLGKEIDIKVANALKLVCTEETIQSVKDVRAELNKENKNYEEQRKVIKNKILEPYEAIETIYNDKIKSKYAKADIDLKTKIETVENELKNKRTEDVKSYFNEYLASKNIDFITYENANINVTLSASIKSLKDSAKNYIDRIASDLEVIASDENSVEILVEYNQNGFNASSATLTVRNRLKAIEEAKARAEQQAQAKVEEVKAAEKVEVLVRPKEVVKEETKTATFKVTATILKLIELKKFLEIGGYEYEE